MSVSLSPNPRNILVSRTRLLAAVSLALATISVGGTLAVLAGGGAQGSAGAEGTPETASPDRATLYHRSAEAARGPGRSQPTAAEPGRSAAERFHHFR